ncbi:ParB family protein [Yersinia kristensenii]|uniref:ParB family protein n=1 Tax=Yersinia kristensenii TaxID=28152 RepID=UPI001C60F6DA|nr:ParB family protein [Yersinia kristensenii]MBW5818544.1 ParB family protein [Yersinia kristensenii]
MVVKSIALKEQLLKRGHTPRATSNNVAILPVSEIPLNLTLAQLRPNPDNPRTSRNPKYEEIKASIRARGLDSIPKVTKDPENEEDVYIFSDGGNTRYSILMELWTETQDERFHHIQCIFKPWPGRLQCLIGHLAENDVRGDLLFIEKALGIAKVRSIYEKQLGKTISQRELESLLRTDGYPITQSNISRMNYTVEYLYPYIPTLLNSGMGRPQIIQLIALRTTAQKSWEHFSINYDFTEKFDDVFGQVCQDLDNPEIYTYDVFKDELIGALLKALPVPDITYDRWLIELDPTGQNRRKLFSKPTQTSRHNPDEKVTVKPPFLPLEILDNTVSPIQVSHANPRKQSHKEEQLDLYHPPKESTIAPIALANPTPVVSIQEPTSFIAEPLQTLDSSVAFANAGLEPVTDIWLISTLQDDIEHLQDMAFRLAFELAESIGIESSLQENKERMSAGYSFINLHSATLAPEAQLLMTLCAESESPSGTLAFLGVSIIGSADPLGEPRLDDICAVKYLRLLRVLRRLRELQREEARNTRTSKDAYDA